MWWHDKSELEGGNKLNVPTLIEVRYVESKITQRRSNKLKHDSE